MESADGGRDRRDGLGKDGIVAKGQQFATVSALKRRDVQIAELSFEGYTAAEIAGKISLSVSQVRRVLARDDIKQLQKDHAMTLMVQASSKAAMVLREQLDDDNPWIRQNAASRILDFVRSMDKDTATTVMVSFGSMPQPAMPAPTADGDVD